MRTPTESTLTAPLAAVPAAPPGPPARRRVHLHDAGRVVPVVVALLAVFALWELAIHVFHISSFLLPAPEHVVASLWNGLSDGAFGTALWVTGVEVVSGLVLGAAAGVVLGIAITRWRTVESGVYPLVIAFHSVPTIAVAPLILVYLGYGISTNVVVTSLVTFFPLVVNTVAGIRSVSEEQVNVLAALSATQGQIFRKVKLPAALPYIFTGLDMASVLAVIGAVVAEFLGSNGGLGYLEQQYNYHLDSSSVYAILFLLGLLGVVMHSIVVLLRRFAISWE